MYDATSLINIFDIAANNHVNAMSDVAPETDGWLRIKNVLTSSIKAISDGLKGVGERAEDGEDFAIGAGVCIVTSGIKLGDMVRDNLRSRDFSEERIQLLLQAVAQVMTAGTTAFVEALRIAEGNDAEEAFLASSEITVLLNGRL